VLATHDGERYRKVRLFSGRKNAGVRFVDMGGGRRGDTKTWSGRLPTELRVPGRPKARQGTSAALIYLLFSFIPPCLLSVRPFQSYLLARTNRRPNSSPSSNSTARARGRWIGILNGMLELSMKHVEEIMMPMAVSAPLTFRPTPYTFL
jgi:hypothetical protein